MTLPALLSALSERIATPAADLTAADLDALRALIPATEEVLSRHLPPWHEAEYGEHRRGDRRSGVIIATDAYMGRQDQYRIMGVVDATVPKSAGLDFTKAVADLLARAAGYVLVDG